MRPIDADALKQNHDLYKCYRYFGSYEDMCYAQNTLTYFEIREMIDDAPTLNEWFPVNEKLPAEEGLYLVTAVCGEGKVITIGSYYESDKKWDLEKRDKNLTIACWCKLPEEDDNESIT